MSAHPCPVAFHRISNVLRDHDLSSRQQHDYKSLSNSIRATTCHPRRLRLRQNTTNRDARFLAGTCDAITNAKTEPAFGRKLSTTDQ